MIDLPNEMVQAYVQIPKQLFDNASEDLFIGIADGGNHYLEHGITEGTKLVFDANLPFQKGKLSCFMGKDKKLHVFATRKRGYTHLGRLIATIHAH